jgi:hypothetical protein
MSAKGCVSFGDICAEAASIGDPKTASRHTRLFLSLRAVAHVVALRELSKTAARGKVVRSSSKK